MSSIEENNKVFAKRLQAINNSPQGKLALKAMRDAQRWFKKQYYKAALRHWKEQGNSASTGYGYEPEGRYQTKKQPLHCASQLAEKLARDVGEYPDIPPGKP